MIVQVLTGIGLPAALAAVVLLIGWRPWPRTRQPEDAGWATALAFGGAFLAAFIVQQGMPSIPPHERWEWIALIMAGATVLGIIDGMLRRQPVRTFTLAAIAGAAVGYALRLPDLDLVEARASLGVAILGLVLVLDPLAARRPGPRLPIALVIVMTTLATAAQAAAFGKLAFIAGAMAAAAGVHAVVAILNPKLSLAPGGALVVAIALVLLSATGHAYDYGDLPWWMFVVPAASLVLMWAGEIKPIARRRWLSAAIGLVLVAAACACVLVPCAIALSKSLAGGGEGGYGY